MIGKRQFLICLSALFACGSWLDSMPRVHAYDNADAEVYEQRSQTNAYQAIRAYWKSELIGDMRGLENDADLAACVKQLDDKAKHYLETMLDPSASEHLWNDAAYNNAATGAKATESLDRLRLISIQIWEPTSSLYQNKEAVAKVKAAMRFILDKKYGPNTSKDSSNWWDWEIGAPKSMVDVAILMYDDLDSATITDITKTVDRFVPKADYRLNSTLKETGANLCDKVAIVIKRAALDGNEERLSHAQKSMSPLFGYSNSGDGYYPDGSFIQHGNIPYNGSYGYVLLDELTNCIIMLSFSDYAIDREDITFYENTLLHHYIPFLSHGGNMVDSVRGRAVSRKSQQGDTMGMQTMGILLQYADAAATASTREAIYQQLKGIATSKFKQSQSEDFSLLAYADYMRVKNLVNHDAYPAMSRNSFSVYSFMDRIVTHRENFTFTLAANSARMCTEQGNSENLLGRYQGQGYTQIYNDDINQYNEDYHATVDQMRLAGVTTAHQQLGFLTAGQSRWSGGTTLDGVNGVSGFELTGDKKLTTLSGGFGSETDTGVKSGITAKKSYFVFGDKIVYLGSGINNLGYDVNVDSVESIVENRKASASMQLSVDGTNVVSANGSDTISNPQWAYLSGKTANSGIGYVFLEDMDLYVKRETRNATWSDVNKLAKFTDSTPVSNDFISMSVEHGQMPSNETYAWITMPNVTQAQISAYLADPTIEILDNNSTVQAVKEKESGQSAYNFFTQGKSSDDVITVSAPASIILKQSDAGYQMALSDPTRSQASIDVTIKGFVDLTHVGISEGDAQVVSTSNDSMTVRVNLANKDGQPRIVEIGTTFETTSANLALNKDAQASSVVQNSATQQRLAKFAVDGDASTRWASNYERAAEGKAPLTTDEADVGWLAVDLGEEMNFNQVRILWEAALSNDYDIQITNDISNDDSWNTIAKKKDTTSADEAKKNGGRTDVITFDEVSARYIRMKSNLGSRPRLPDGTGAGGLSIWEFEVYNSLDLTKSATKAEQLLKDYPEASAFATPTQYETLKNNVQAQLQNAKNFMANGANYTEEELRNAVNALEQACREYDKAVLHVIGLQIDDPMKEAIDKGESKTLGVTFTPINAYRKEVEWSSSNRSVARVDEHGVVSGVSSGTATITVTSKDSGLSDSVVVTVVVKPKTITLDQTSMEMKKGDSAALKMTVSPTEVSDAQLRYKSNNTNVVRVGNDGTLEAVGVGETDIVVTSALNPQLEAVCHIVVKANLIVSSENLALTAGAQASASSSVQAAGVSPQGAIDGSFDTRWASNYRAPLSEEECEAQWWMVEFPQAITFNHIDITWFSPTVYGKEYKILISDDGIDWKETYHETAGKNQKYGFDFETVSAKFVKFQGIKRSQTGGGYGIVEFEIYEKLNYDTIITEAKRLLNLYPSALNEYSALQNAVKNAEELVDKNPNFEADELKAVLTAVNDAMIAYKAVIIPVSGIQGGEMSMNAEEEAPLSYIIVPSDATNPNISFVNEHPDIVSVDDNGIVHAIKRGTAIVHITTVDGGFRDDVVIHVTSNYAPTINASDITLTPGKHFNPLDYVSAVDAEDGEIVLDESNIIKNTVDTSKEGSGIVTYRVTDSDGNVSEKTITVTIIRDEALENARAKLKRTLKLANTLKESDYTSDSYQLLQAQIQQGEAVLNDENATAEEVNAAYEALLAAIKALSPHSIGSIEDKNTEVTIVGTFPADTKLVVDPLSGDAFDALIASIKDPRIIQKYNFEQIFDIYLLRSGSVYHHEGYVTIRVKLVEEWLDKQLKVLYIADDGTVSEIASTVENGYISFRTNHNSYYAIVTEKGGNPITDTGTASQASGGWLVILCTMGMLGYMTKKRKKA